MSARIRSQEDDEEGDDNLFSKVLNGMKSVFNNAHAAKKSAATRTVRAKPNKPAPRPLPTPRLPADVAVAEDAFRPVVGSESCQVEDEDGSVAPSESRSGPAEEAPRLEAGSVDASGGIRRSEEREDNETSPRDLEEDATRRPPNDGDDVPEDASQSKPRIVLKFRSEKTGLRSANVKIVSDGEKREDSEKEPAKAPAGGDGESDGGPRAGGRTDSNSEDSPPPNAEKSPVKRSARRRSKDFRDNVLANAIARKEKSYEAPGGGQTRPSRRIKPTAKVLANRELRLGLEAQVSARSTAASDGSKLTRSKLKKSPPKGANGSPPTKVVAEPKKKVSSDGDGSDPTEIAEVADAKSSDDGKRESEDEPVPKRPGKGAGRRDDDDRERKRINKLKKKHLKKLGLKAVSERNRKRAMREREALTDESTMDSTNTDAIIEHLNSRSKTLNRGSNSEMKSPGFTKIDNLSHKDIKKLRSSKPPKRKLSVSDSEDSANNEKSSDNEEVIPCRVTRKRSRMGCSNSSDNNESDIKKDSSEENVSGNIMGCFCNDETNLYANPASLAETEFCHAVEYIGGRTIGCGRPVTVGKLVRAGPRAPYFIACDLHHHRLILHHCCAGCGVFCTQGVCYQCSEGHLFHWECSLPFVPMLIPSGQHDMSLSPSHDQQPNQPKGTITDLYNSDPGCPHCGLHPNTLEPVNTDCHKVNLEMNCSSPMILLPNPRLQWVPARMSFSTIKKTSKKLNKHDELSVLPNDLVISLRSCMEKINAKRENLIDYDDLLMRVSSENQIDMDLINAVCEKENTIDNIVAAINSGGDPRKHIPQVDDGTFIHLAARELNLSAIHIFRMFGCDLNTYDGEQRTPLMLALMNYDTEAIDKEDMSKDDSNCENQYDINQTEENDKVEFNAVFVSQNGEASNVAEYSETKQNVSDKELVGHQKEYKMVIEYLLKAGSDVSLKGPNGATALHLAAKFGDIKTCLLILNSYSHISKAFINQKDDGGWTPLIWAIENKSSEVVRFLLENGSDPMLRDAENNTSLHWAASVGSSVIIEDILNFGCQVNAVNLNGDTPLHLSARQNHFNCVVILLARGAQINVKNSDMETALQCVTDETSDCYSALAVNEHLQKIINPSYTIERVISQDISNGKEGNPIRCVNGIDDETLDEKFTYITKNCFTIDINIDRKISSMQVCQCRGVCGQSEDSCACSNLSMQSWYDANGRLVSNFDYNDPPMIFECNDACSCNKLRCLNRGLDQGGKVSLKVFRQTGNTPRGGGWGVCTMQPILKGSLVSEYVGEILPGSLAYHRDDDSYLFELEMKDDILQDTSEPFCIDAKHYGNISRFINHKCEPNLVPVRIFADHRDLRFPRIAFFARKNIDIGEELGFDYGAKFWNIKIKSFTCNCNSRHCRYSSKNAESGDEYSEDDDADQAETEN